MLFRPFGAPHGSTPGRGRRHRPTAAVMLARGWQPRSVYTALGQTAWARPGLSRWSRNVARGGRAEAMVSLVSDRMHHDELAGCMGEGSCTIAFHFMWIAAESALGGVDPTAGSTRGRRFARMKKRPARNSTSAQEQDRLYVTGAGESGHSRCMCMLRGGAGQRQGRRWRWRWRMG